MKRYVPYMILAALVVGVLFVYPKYQNIFAPSIRIEGADTYDLYIPTGADYIYVGEKLLEDKVLAKPQGFQWVAQRMNYPRHVHPGKYVLKDGMSNREVIQLLRSAKQTPINFTFIKFRNAEDFALHAAERLEFGKTELMQVLKNEEWLTNEVGVTPETVLGIMIPNTYELFWTTKPEAFVKRMYKEYRNFWNPNREALRKSIGLTRQEVMTLASIVEEETIKNDEKDMVAGLYLNRVRKKMPLQADPTVKYAVGDFTLKRILNVHLDTDHPYNTYMYGGIPPGPICTASIPSIDAVLANKKHDYFYMCANPNGSGYHQFSKTLSEHNSHAHVYHQKLDSLGIR